MGNWGGRDGVVKFTIGGMVVVEGKRGREVKKKKKRGVKSLRFGRAKPVEGEWVIAGDTCFDLLGTQRSGESLN